MAALGVYQTKIERRKHNMRNASVQPKKQPKLILKNTNFNSIRNEKGSPFISDSWIIVRREYCDLNNISKIESIEETPSIKVMSLQACENAWKFCTSPTYFAGNCSENFRTEPINIVPVEKSQQGNNHFLLNNKFKFYTTRIRSVFALLLDDEYSLFLCIRHEDMAILRIEKGTIPVAFIMGHR
jgi:hypothetical protein